MRGFPPERVISERSEGDRPWAHDPGQRRQEMLVDVAHSMNRTKVFLELGVLRRISRRQECQVSRDLEPLAPLAEVGGRDLGRHGLVTTSVQPPLTQPA